MTRTNRTHFIIVVLLGLVAAALAYLAFTQVGVPWYFTWLIFWSVVAFFYYGFDKQQAQQGNWRVPEVVLHGLALLGGFIGAWLGMTVFHHKNRKPVFVIVMVVSAVIHGLLYWGWIR